MKYFICVITLFLCLACVENKDQLNDLSLEDANRYKVDSFFNDYFVFLDSVESNQFAESDFPSDRLRAVLLELDFFSCIKSKNDTSVDSLDINRWRNWYKENGHTFVWDTTYNGIRLISDSI